MVKRILVMLMVVAPMVAQGPADAEKWAAREEHNGFLIAADPYGSAARSKEKFGKKHPVDAGILPLEVYFKNNGDQAVQIEMSDIRLLLHPPGGRRQQLLMLDLDTVIERIVNKKKGGPEPSLPRLPIPRGSPQVGRSKDWMKVEEVLRPLVVEMDIIPPRGYTRGFIFFDLGGRMEMVEHAALYVPNLRRLPEGKGMLFFEVELLKK